MRPPVNATRMRERLTRESYKGRETNVKETFTNRLNILLAKSYLTRKVVLSDRNVYVSKYSFSKSLHTKNGANKPQKTRFSIDSGEVKPESINTAAERDRARPDAPQRRCQLYMCVCGRGSRRCLLLRLANTRMQSNREHNGRDPPSVDGETNGASSYSRTSRFL